MEDSVFIKTPEFHPALPRILRRNGFAWQDRLWTQKTTRSDITDRIVEVAVELLNVGYIVRLPDEDYVQRTVNSEYTPFNTRRIRATDTHFTVKWDREDGDFYNAARRITGAKWDKKASCIVVPMEAFDEVLDFAERFGFTVSEKAQKLAEKGRNAKNTALICAPKKKEKQGTAPIDKKPHKLEVPTEVKIDESLLDRED